MSTRNKNPLMSPKTEYIAGETRWLLSFGMHPENVAIALNKKPSGIYKMSLTHKMADIREAFAPYSKGVRL